MEVSLEHSIKYDKLIKKLQLTVNRMIKIKKFFKL